MSKTTGRIVSSAPTKRKIGVYGDFFGSHTGFSTVTNNIFTRLDHKYEISQLAVNYTGDYHKLQERFRFYPTVDMYHINDFPYGYSKVAKYLEKEKPDLFVVVQDPWIAPRVITPAKAHNPNLKTVLYCPVDSPNVPRHFVNVLNQFDHVVTYTEFGKRELEYAGLTVPVSVIPHGVDTEIFKPGDKVAARKMPGWDDEIKNGFIVLYIGTNQPRKKIDVFLYTMNKWIQRYPHDDVFCYYHGALVTAGGLNIPQYLEYLDRENARLGYNHRIGDRFLTTAGVEGGVVIKKETMPRLYQLADVYMHACANEGWGLPLHEAMACGIPSICPEYSALAEWTVKEDGPGVLFVPVRDEPDAVVSGANTEHRIMNSDWAVEALENLYQSRFVRDEVARRGYEVATQPKHLWPNIVHEFDKIFESVLGKE